jgi:tRNA pseudouridine13 synthase
VKAWLHWPWCCLTTDSHPDFLQQAVHALAYAAGPPPATARLKSQAEDFQVTELPLVDPTGSGEHAWLYVCKRNRNSADVAGLLARHAGVAPRAVGFAGLKDRLAETRQWFSVHLPGQADPDWAALNDATLCIERATRHTRKLQRGALRGNAFAITLREVQGDPVQLAARLALLGQQGVPNYFGPQRFGKGGANLVTALQLFANPRLKLSRTRRGLALSAARALLFNRVLSRRVADGSWNTVLEGDAMQLAGSHSFFIAERPDAELAARLAAFDIHPTGPLHGRGVSPAQGACRELEQAELAAYPEFTQGLEAAGLRQERRALRVVPGELRWDLTAPDTLRLSFSLPAGSFATSVLRELVDT